jgi:uncharacterized membrane protein
MIVLGIIVTMFGFSLMFLGYAVMLTELFPSGTR